jgi:hypothetical protein
MFDDCRMCCVEHSDDAVVRLIQTTYPAADLDYDGNVDDPTYTYIKYDALGRKAFETVNVRPVLILTTS